MRSINPPPRFYICHVSWLGRLWPQPEEEQGVKKKKKKNHFMTLRSLLWTVTRSCKIPGSSNSHHSDLAWAEQRLWVGLELWSQQLAALGVANNSGQEPAVLPQTCTGTVAASLATELPESPETGEPSMNAKVPALQQECKGPLKWKKRFWCISNLAVTASLLAFCLHP